MTFLLNVIPFLILLVGAGVTYLVWGNTKKVASVVVTTAFVWMVYWSVQPSYIPKTGVKPLPRMELPVDNEPEIVDNLRSDDKTTEERTEHFNNNVITYDDEIKKILKGE